MTTWVIKTNIKLRLMILDLRFKLSELTTRLAEFVFATGRTLLELRAAGIAAESPKCVGLCVAGLAADSPVAAQAFLKNNDQLYINN